METSISHGSKTTQSLSVSLEAVALFCDGGIREHETECGVGGTVPPLGWNPPPQADRLQDVDARLVAILIHCLHFWASVYLR